MQVKIFPNVSEMGKNAARTAAVGIRNAIVERGEAFLILATGASQFSMLSELVKEPNIDWSKVTVFHLDEYIGLPISHPASFRRYLKERFYDLVPTLKQFHFVQGDAEEPAKECQRLDDLISQVQIDVACIGIGENGHIAFNDPPADFATEKPYLMVSLDDVCRNQQFKEGWFPTLDAVPKQAISMSCQQILKSRQIVCTVPDRRKAQAVLDTLTKDVTSMIPATILKQHSDTTFFLDNEAAALLPETMKF